MAEWRVDIADSALQDLLAVLDMRERRLLAGVIDQLATDPDKRGKPLSDILRRLWSVRAVGQRYRIVYRLDELGKVVTVVRLGLRREGHRSDVYRRAEELLNDLDTDHTQTETAP